MATVNPKVTAAAAAAAGVQLAVALVEWLAVTDVPGAVEIPATILATFAAGWLQPDRKGRHASD